ncbi:MAG: SDR family NAD(P)-dependent oxidoreductase [Candidatus Promineifilaceae bacterium]
MTKSKPATNYRNLLKDALIKIKRMQAQLAAAEKKKNEPIAIVGVGCRFPGGANSPAAFWQLLREGVDTISEIPKDRWDIDDYFDPEKGLVGKMYAREGGFLDDIDQFDPHFFNISPREAATMDPQQRLLLEVAWEALEQAGQLPSQLRNSQTGVFIGMMPAEYTLLTHYADKIDTYTATGTDNSMAAGRLAYILGAHGPALTLNTVCSSSLVAVHLAAQSLRRGECDLALAGGVNLILTPEQMIVLSRIQALSAQSRCRTFDAQADGMARGEGCGVVVLKRLSDALADGDSIWGVMRGSAVNHDGPSSGLTVPSELAQEALLSQALDNAQVRPDEVAYIEAHGTGTKLGDPIEVGALGTIFAKQRQNPLWIGSVKTNLGHLEAAAGMAGLIKVLLSMRHGEIPPSLHFETPNPLIDWDRLPMQVPTSMIEWPAEQRIAGVSSFGLSGTNAHLIIEAAPETEPVSAPPTSNHQLLLLSAKSEAALRDLVEQYASYLPDSAATLGAICHSATLEREQFAYRFGAVATSKTQLRDRLLAFLTQDEVQGVVNGTVDKPKVAFLFTGHGAQYIGMGRDLYDNEPVFRAILDRCEPIFNAALHRSLLDLFYSGRAEDEAALMDNHAYGQAANFAFQCALVELWKSWGVQPDVVMGHSLGDFAAAYTAGVLSLEDGVSLVAERGRLMQSAAGNGRMLSILATETMVEELIIPYPALSIAVINGEKGIVVSGETESVVQLSEQLRLLGIKHKQLAIPVAAHSPLLDPVLGQFEQTVARQSLSKPRLHYVSSMTGQLANEALTDPTYWRRQLRNGVRFADGMQTLSGQGCNIFVEIGPKPTLLGLGGQIVQDDEASWLPSVRSDVPDGQQMLESLAQLHVRGVAVDWQAFYQDQPAQHVTLPTYPFQRQRYWVNDGAPQKRGALSAELSPLVDKMVQSPLHNATIFETQFSTERLPFLAEHRVYGTIISPGACQVAVVLSSAEILANSPAIQIEDIILPAALVLPDDMASRTAQVVLENDSQDFQLVSFDAHDSQPVTHATGRLTALTAAENSPALAELQANCPTSYPIAKLDAYAQAQQIELGDSFHWMTAIWKGEGRVLAQLAVPESIGSLADYVLHPGLLDACFQVACVPADDDAEPETRLPFAMTTLRVFDAGKGRTWWCHAQQSDDERWTIHLLDTNGELLVEIVGFETRVASQQSVGGREIWRDWLYEVDWQPQARFGLLPTYLPSPAALIQQPTAEARRVTEYNAALTELETLSVDYILDAFEKLGLNFTVGASWRTEQLIARLSIMPQHRRLFTRLLAILADEGILTRRATDWQVAQLPEPNSVAMQQLILQEEFGALVETELTLLTRCGDKLTQVLRGAQDPLALLFPEGDASLVNRLYQDAPVSQLLNQQMRQVVQAALTHLPIGRGAHILEIGAGTGGTTAALIGHLSAENTHYQFTDIGTTFLQAAQEKFSDYPFISYQTLDIEQDPLTQGFERHQYDLIIAANVLHATQDLTQTLTHARSLLAPNGLLLMIEQTKASRWVDLTFGMTEGWWRFTDTAWRTEHPLLDVPQWSALLQECGFDSVEAVPNAQEIGQAVIIAHADKTVQPLNRPWLIFAESADNGLELATRLQKSGEQPMLLLPNREDARSFDVPTYYLDDPAVFQQILAPDHLVCLWGKESTIDDIAQLQARSQTLSEQTLHLVQGVLSAYTELPKVWLVSREAQAVNAQDNVSGMVQALVWGIGRVIALEHPELEVSCVDLSAENDLSTLWAELTSAPTGQHENQIALRDNTRYAARLTRFTESTLPDTPYQLVISERGSIENLQLQSTTRRLPADNEIEIRVHATGLNFLDVLDSLGMLPIKRRDDEFGSECAGEVIAIGLGVEQFKVGDRVMALAFGSFSSHYTISADLAAPIPTQYTFAEAATIPINFLTSYYALCQVAQMKAGEKVLIHAASGGTGMAAIQLAQMVGAEIFATASPRKWETLRRLGIKHIYNSRTLAFADEISADTNGAGVDLALNSLTGEGFVDATLSVLGQNGRFVEIAKRDVWNQERITAQRADVTFHFVDLRQASLDDSQLVQTMFKTLMRSFGETLRPLPLKTFPMHDVQSAFRTMQRTNHIGKIVVTQPVSKPITLHDAATYLVIGGLGGLGLLTAQWLAEKGAKQLMLMGRSAPRPDVQMQLDALREAGVTITIARADVSNREQVASAIDSIDPRYPLRGVIHSAGVLDDGIFQEQTWSRFAPVIGAKAWGAWNLHQLTEQLPLDFFVLYASVAGLLGSAGQANHAAANAFLDALIHKRRASGLPALAIDWGAWSEIGEAARRGDVIKLKAGMGVIDPKRGLQIMDHLFETTPTQVGVIPLDWSLYETDAPLLVDFKQVAQAETTHEQPISFLDELTASSADQQNTLLTTHVQLQLARVLGHPTHADISTTQPFAELGLDSLMSVELRNRLQKTLSCRLSSTLVFEYPSIEELVGHLSAEVLQLATPEPTVIVEETPSLEDTLQDVEDDDIEALLMQELLAIESEKIG